MSKLFGLLKRRNLAFAMVGVMLTFGGAFTIFTYLRPFLKSRTRVDLPGLSLLLLGLGMAGFLSTYAGSTLVGKYLYGSLRWLPLALGAVTLVLLAVGRLYWPSGVCTGRWSSCSWPWAR